MSPGHITPFQVDHGGLRRCHPLAMTSYDADLQAAVDSTSVAKDAGVAGDDELIDYLRQQLAEREIETSDESWLQRVVDGIRRDENFMIDSEPNDFSPRHD